MLNKLQITEKLRPETFDDLILTKKTKEFLRDVISHEQCSHLLFYGSVGVGKTSTAKVIANELDADLLAVNACEVSTEEFRNNIKGFANSFNVFKSRQVVLFDEADSLSPKIQKEMKFVLENECLKTAMIFTTNEEDNIIDAIRSRCLEIDFDLEFSAENSLELKELIYKRVRDNFYNEKRIIDVKKVQNLINHYYPDLRRINNYLSIELKMINEYKSDLIKDKSDMICSSKKKPVTWCYEETKKKAHQPFVAWSN